MSDIGAELDVPGFGHQDSADHTFAQHRDCIGGNGRAALLGTVLNDAIATSGSIKQQLALTKAVAARLLDIDVLAGLERQHGGGRMPVVWRGDDDGVDCGLVQQAPHVGDGSSRWHAGLLRGVSYPGSVRVAEVIAIVKEPASSPATTDQPDNDLLTRAACVQRACHTERYRAQAGLLKKDVPRTSGHSSAPHDPNGLGLAEDRPQL